MNHISRGEVIFFSQPFIIMYINNIYKMTDIIKEEEPGKRNQDNNNIVDEGAYYLFSRSG